MSRRRRGQCAVEPEIPRTVAVSSELAEPPGVPRTRIAGAPEFPKRGHGARPNCPRSALSNNKNRLEAPRLQGLRKSYLIRYAICNPVSSLRPIVRCEQAKPHGKAI